MTSGNPHRKVDNLVLSVLGSPSPESAPSPRGSLRAGVVSSRDADRADPARRLTLSIAPPRVASDALNLDLSSPRPGCAVSGSFCSGLFHTERVAPKEKQRGRPIHLNTLIFLQQTRFTRGLTRRQVPGLSADLLHMRP